MDQHLKHVETRVAIWWVGVSWYAKINLCLGNMLQSGQIIYVQAFASQSEHVQWSSLIRSMIPDGDPLWYKFLSNWFNAFCLFNSSSYFYLFLFCSFRFRILLLLWYIVGHTIYHNCHTVYHTVYFYSLSILCLCCVLVIMFVPFLFACCLLFVWGGGGHFAMFQWCFVCGKRAD